MRLLTTFKSLMALFLTVSFTASAQLSGDYTVGSSGYFPTLAHAVDSLNLQGISSSVTFKIQSDTYNERVTINAFSGSSATDTVVFTSETENPADVTIALDAPDSLNNFLFKFNGCERVSVKNMSFHTSSNTLSTHMILTNGASHNKIQNCQFVASSVIESGLDSSVVISCINPLERGQFNQFVENTIFGGAIGLSITGEIGLVESGNMVLKNSFVQQTFNAISMVYQKDFEVSKNLIDYQDTGTSLYLAHPEGRGYVLGNKITASGNFGLHCTYHDYGGIVDTLFIENNMVSNPNGAAFLGFYSDGLNIVHNSFYSGNKTTQTIRLNEIAESNIINNLFVNDSAYGIIQYTNIGVNVECNNNGFSNPNEDIGLSDGGTVTSFADWQVSPRSPGASSVYDASFVFRNNNHDLTPYCGMPNVFRTTNLTKLKFDYNGNLRSTTDPWMGAAELILPNYHTADFEGFVTNGTDTLKNGMIEVYVDTSSSMIFDELYSIAINSDGSYECNSIRYADEYWIKIIPSDARFITSYHNGNLRWDEDVSFKLSDSCAAYFHDIIPRKMFSIDPGSFSIAGNVSETGGTSKMLGTDPIPGLDVVLDKIPPSKNTVAVTQTDINGDYYFGNLPEGTYVVTIDYEGLHSDTIYEVNLNSDSTEAVDLNYCVDLSDRIQGCSPSIESTEEVFKTLNVFPNPVNDVLTVKGLTGDFDVLITDINGKVVYSNPSANGNLEIPTKQYQSGVYLLSVINKGVSKVVKVIK